MPIDWEQRKLGEVFEFQYGEFNNNPDNGGEYPIYGANGIIGGYTDWNAENSSIIGHMGAYAGYVVWGEGKHFVTYNGTIARPKDNSIDSKYGYYLLDSKKIYKICAGSGQPFVSYSDLNGIDILLPKDKDEQRLLAYYFTNLDHLITLHHRECIILRKTKVNDWEQRKVSEMFKVARGYVLPATDTSQEMTDEIPYPVYSSQTKDNGLMGYYSDYLYEDAITWTTDGANAGTVNFRAGKFYCTNVCGVLLSDKIETNKVIAEALNNVAKRYVSYVGNPKLMNNVMADIQIAVPTSQKERDRISSYFSYLDHLITLHQHKCDELQNLKKYMLQNMFV